MLGAIKKENKPHYDITKIWSDVFSQYKNVITNKQKWLTGDFVFYRI
jgi:hypothetical protein